MENSHVRVILDPGNKGWILEKIAFRLESQFKSQVLNADVGSKPLLNAKFNFWMQYTDVTLPSFARKGQSNCFALVTHVDDSFKLARIKLLLSLNVNLIFMSEAHANEIATLLNIDRQFDFSLIPSDFNSLSRPYRIGMVSKCYPDGRKNEKWLVDLAEEGILENCCFVVLGEGWGPTINQLRSLGVSCEEFSESRGNAILYSEIKSFYDNLDLYVYFGFDEGALGSLDAYLFRKDLLVSNQGFHAHFDIDDDSKFSSFEEARSKINRKIQKYESWLESILPWTWDFYSKDLLRIFEENRSGITKVAPKGNLLSANFSLLISNHNYRQLLPFSLKRLILIRLREKLKKFLFRN